MTMLPPDFGGKEFNSWKKRAGNITGEPVQEIDGAEPEYFVCGTIPLGLQHVLAMFVGNLTPLLIITGTYGLAGGEFADLQLSLLQNAMLFAGIVTLIQLVFGGSGIVPAALVAILLNIILPKEKEA